MDNTIKIGKKRFIRAKGKDELWLQDMICANPEKLGLGNDIEVVKREKKQYTSGKLDILLRDSSNNTLYETEVMLGETDPSHIIRTIEYWDNERRVYPQRQHFAVLIAESFNRRYFNVIQLLSQTIPIIAIQADLIETEDGIILNFTKIMDMYVPQEEEESPETNIAQWEKKAKWLIEAVNSFEEVLSGKYDKTSITTTYTQSYARININGKSHYFFHKRNSPNVFIEFYVKDEEKKSLIEKLLADKGFDYNYNNYKAFTFATNKDFIKKHKDLFLEIHEIKDRELSPEDE